MHIAICHAAVIPPLKYGGTERAIFWLVKALIEAGHKVTLVARPGSHVPGATTIPVQEGERAEELVPAECDILHLFGTPSPPPKRPFLVTIEGNGQPGETFHSNTVFVSRKHAENHGSTHFVYNGLDPEDFPCDEKRGDYLVFLAKASWSVKNLQGAIQIARGAGLPLKVMGSRNWPFGLQRFARWRGVEYLGMLGDAEKRQILRKARGLLFPVVWHEPFGIAITEALASGCPVFGTPYGSIPEIVTPQTGFLSNRASEHIQALKTRKFDPRTCRARINEGFSHHDMARKYLAYYREILEKGTLAGQPPRTIPYDLPLAWAE